MTLQVSATAWLIYSVTLIVWAATGLLFSKRLRSGRFDLRWSFTTLFGYAWLAFFVVYILRFLLITYDPELFRRSGFPLWLLPEQVITESWFCLLLFWCLFCMGFALIFFRLQRRAPRVLFRLDALGHFHPDRIKFLDAMSAITLITAIWVNYPGFPLPRALLTPLGRLSALYAIPLTIAWCLHFSGEPIRWRRFLYMLPGIVTYVLNPYREHLLVLLFCWLVPALLVGGKLGTKGILISLGVILFLGTIVTSAYREIKWQDPASADERPTWVILSNRFHGFDSMALTVYAVPHLFAYSERSIIGGLVYQVFPRLFFPSKEESSRAMEFSTTIWALDESDRVISRSPASIALSMAGDLYSTNGPVAVILGALIWGAVVGFLQMWANALAPVGRTILIVLFGMGVAGGMERDFVSATAGLIHLVLVVLLVAAFFPLRPSSSPSYQAG